MSDNDSVFSDDNLSRQSYGNNSIGLTTDHMAFFNKANQFQNAKPKFVNKQIKQNKFNNRKGNNRVIEENGFESQFAPLAFDNPSAPVSKNNVEHKVGNKAGIAKLEMERELALKGQYSNFNNNDNMTYGIVDEKNMAHNNMVPFFRSKTGMGYAYDSAESAKVNQVNQRKMELFSGSSKSVDYRPKTERKPLFNPIIGAEKWIYGSPNATNYFETRYIPGKERRNEKPFQEARVTPGLAKGYNEISKEGFNDSFRALPKTVDELRTADRPKVSYGSVIIPGMKGERRGIQSQVAHHRPPTMKEQDPRDMLKSLTYYRAPAIYGNVDESVPMTNRAVRSEEWYGPVGASNDEARPTSALPQYKTPSKENFLAPQPRNTTGVDREKATTNTANTYDMKQTKRVTTENNGYVGIAGRGETNKQKAIDFNDVPDLNNRNTTENRTYNGVVGTGQMNKNKIFNPNDIMDPTVRDQTGANGYVGHANNQQINKPQATNFENMIRDPNMRNASEVNTYIGNANNSNLQKSYSYDPANWTPDETKKSQLAVNTHIGMTNNQALNKNYGINYELSRPDITRKDTVINNTYIGGSTTEWKKQQLFDFQNNIPDPNNRSFTGQNTHNGMVGRGDLNKGIAFTNDILDPTKKDETINNTYAGHMGNTSFNKAKAIDYTDVPDISRKEFTINNTHVGNTANSSYNKGFLRSDSMIPDNTKRATTEKNIHVGTIGTGQLNKQLMFSYEGAITDPNNRNTTENNIYNGSIGVSQLNRAKLANLDSPDLTKKDMVINNGYIGASNQSNLNQSYTWSKEWISDIGIREQTAQNTHINPATMHEGLKTRVRDDIENTLINDAKDKINVVRDQGMPTSCNYNVGPIGDYTMAQLREPISIQRESYGAQPWGNPLECTTTLYTRQPTPIQNANTRFDTCILSQLQSNPFINDTQMKSVSY
jgi:hypothetical protein